MPIVPSPRNPLLYPCGVTPSFAPSHVAGNGVDFSAFPSCGGFLNLIRGPIVGVSTSTSATVSGIIGPATKYANAGAANTKFAGYSATRLASSTIAAVVLFTAVNTFQYIFADNSNQKGNALSVNSSGTLQWTMFGAVAESSAITLSVGIPYFVAASQNAAVGINYIAVDLRTGATKLSTSASSNPSQTTLDGNYTISATFNSVSVQGLVAAVMHSTVYMSMSALQLWAGDPWSFWYPQADDQADWTATPAGFPWWVAQSNNSVIGAGAH